MNNFKNSEVYKNYKTAIQWNIDFGVKISNTPLKSLDKKTLEFRYSLINEEVKELVKAIKEKNLIEIWDSLCDILVTCYGALGVLGYELNINHDYYNSELLDKYYGNVELDNLTENIKEINNKVDTINNLLSYFKYYCDNYTNKLKEISTITHLIIRISINLADVLNMDINKGMTLVNEANYNKSCSTENKAIETVEAYKTNKLGKHYPNATYRKLVKKNITLYIVYDEKTNKILKNIDWKAPNFEKLIKN